MEIKAISQKTTSFKSLRTDKNNISELKEGKSPILYNKKLNIINSLNNLAAVSNRSNIEFLLNIAENLAYGQDGDSEFKKTLDSDGITPQDRENTHWNEILKDTIFKSLNNTDENVKDLKQEAEKIFSTSKPLTPEQKELLDLRRNLTDIIIDDKTLEDTENLILTTNIRKNLDYFTASSEIPFQQKKYCLEKLIYLMSDEYKINPQLEDKKLQVLDEILNDIVVQTPQNDILNTKSIDQKDYGICGAISMSRKRVAYESKDKYIDSILEELNDSDMMEVYDVTELGSGKKVKVPKIEIDYNTILNKGFRIIDTGAFQWMQNGSSIGNGTKKLISYIPFDENSYSIFHDNYWYDNFRDNEPRYHNYLRTLILEKKYVTSALKKKKKINDSGLNIRSAKEIIHKKQGKINAEFNKLLKDIFPDKNDAQITALNKQLINFYTSAKNEDEVNISERMPDDVKKIVISNYLKSTTEGISEEQKKKIDDNSSELYYFISEYVKTDTDLKKLSQHSSLKAKYQYNKDLYRAAAANRLAYEAELNIPECLTKYEINLNIPPRQVQVTNYLYSLLSDFDNSKNILDYILSRQGGNKTPEDLKQELISDIHTIQTSIPVKMDSISQTLTGNTVSENLLQAFGYYKTLAEKNNPEVIKLFTNEFNNIKNKDDVIVFITLQMAKLINSPSEETVNESLQILGYENKLDYIDNVLTDFNNSLTEEKYGEFIQLYGGIDNFNSVMNNINDTYKQSIEQYNKILSKWSVPTQKGNILRQLEKQKYIIPRNNLDLLKKRFDKIEKDVNENFYERSYRESKRSKYNNIYKFSKEEEEILKTIDNSLSKMNKYSKKNYETINRFFKTDFEDEYAQIGMNTGSFYVLEEGHTGSSWRNSVRTYEQITGNPAYIEGDLGRAIKKLKEGNNAITLSMSMLDDDFGFHSIYAPRVSNETFIDPVTHEKTQKDVIWFDNSWGDIEKRASYDGLDGHKYTNYINEGIANGFILAKNGQIGIRTDILTNLTGQIKKGEDKNLTFSIVSNTIIPGESRKNTYNARKLIDKIISQNEIAEIYEELEEKIKEGEKISYEKLSRLDDLAEDDFDELLNRISKIKTKEEYDKLSENDPIKFLTKKLSLYNEAYRDVSKEAVLTASTDEELKKARELLFADNLYNFKTMACKNEALPIFIMDYAADDILAYINKLNEKYNTNTSKEKINDEDIKSIISGIFTDSDKEEKLNGSLYILEQYLHDKTREVITKYTDDKDIAEDMIVNLQNIIQKTIDENFKITDLNSPALDMFNLKDEYIKAIDKYFNPESDEELLEIMKELQNGDEKLTDKFFMELDEEDVGLSFIDPYSFFIKIQDFDSEVINNLYKMVGTNEIYENMENTKDELYRALFIILSNLDTQKYIRRYKDQYLRQLKIRPAYPSPVVIKQKDLENLFYTTFEEISDVILSIKDLNNNIMLLDKLSDLKSETAENDTYQAIINKEEIPVNDSNRKDIEQLITSLEELNKYSNLAAKNENSFNNVNEIINKLLDKLKNNDGTLNGRELAANFNYIFNTFEDLTKISFTTEYLEEQKQAAIDYIKVNLRTTIDSSIDPAYKNKLTEKFHKLINLYYKDADEEKINELQEECMDIILQHNITTKPTVLLNECIRKLQNGEEDDVYNTLKSILLKSLAVAEQTDIHHKLIKNENKGITTKLKQILPKYTISSSKGTGVYRLNDNTGLLYLINELYNLSDGSQLLNQFLTQTGLSEKALDAIIESNNFDEYVTYINDTFALSEIYMEQLTKITNLIHKYITDADKKYKNTKEAFEFIKKQIPKDLKAEESSKMMTAFYSILNNPNILYPQCLNLTGKNMVYTLNSIFYDIATSLSEIISNNNKLIDSSYDSVQNIENLINSLGVNENSPNYDKLLEYDEKCKDIKTMINKKAYEISNQSA